MALVWGVSKTMFGITWAGTYNSMYVIALVCFGMVAFVYRCWVWLKAVKVLAAKQHAQLLLPGFSARRYYARTTLSILGLVFLVLALLRPQWGKREQVVNQEGRDVFIALDISRSMLAADCVPNRLACAKAKIKELLAKLSCERVGLILFSGAAFVQCPLTSDYAAFLLFLDQIDAQTISSGTTALDQAIIQALKSFEAMHDRKNKLLIIFTDGEDFSRNLANIQQHARELGMHIFALGVGSEQGAPVPVFDERGRSVGHQKDAHGQVVISRLNEPMLRALAHDSGGCYVRMTLGDEDVKTIVTTVSRYEKEQFEDRTISRYEEQYPWFIAVSLLCFCIEWLL